MANEGGNTHDPTARRRRIAEKGSDRLALITGGRATNVPSSAGATTHSYNVSCPPTLTRFQDQVLPSDENNDETGCLRKSESTKTESSREANERQSSPNKSKCEATSKNKILLYKTVSPIQLRPAILASQDIRRKCSFFAGIVALLSYVGFPIVGSYIIRSIILWRPLILLLLNNVMITIAPLLIDAMKMIPDATSEEADFSDNLGTPFEWGMLFITGLRSLFMDSCIYSVVVVCGMAFLQKLGF